MTLEELAEKYYNKEIKGHQDTIILDFLVKKDSSIDYFNGDNELFRKAMTSFEIYLARLRKITILKAKGIDPKKHKEYRLVKSKH